MCAEFFIEFLHVKFNIIIEQSEGGFVLRRVLLLASENIDNDRFLGASTADPKLSKMKKKLWINLGIKATAIKF